MTRPRVLASVLVAAVLAGSSVLAACELACASDCARIAAAAPSSGCHESSPGKPHRCADRHAMRLAVVDAAPGIALAVAAPAPTSWIPALSTPLPVLRSPHAATAHLSASPPPVLRV